MLIKSIRIQNFRAFEDSGWVPLGRITVVIGKNNSGKSSLVRAFGILQEGTIQWQRDARLRSELTTIELRGPGEIPPWIPQGEFELMSNWKQNTAPQSLVGKGDAGVDVNFNRSDGKRPLNPIVPLLSRRRPTVFQESINLDSSRQVQIDGSMLAARLSGWIDSGLPEAETYKAACSEILGFVVTVIPTANGQLPGVFVANNEHIPLSQMGDGVTQVASFLLDLATAEDKLFLVEEPEADLHPDALKSILKLIRESSTTNQFIISTHSNIVLRYLGAEPDSLVLNITRDGGHMSPAKVQTVGNSPDERLGVLSGRCVSTILRRFLHRFSESEPPVRVY